MDELHKFESTLSILLDILSPDNFDNVLNVFNVLVLDVEENKIRIVAAVILDKIVRHPETVGLYAKLISTAKSTIKTLANHFLDRFEVKFLCSVKIIKIIGLAPPDLREPLNLQLDAVKANNLNYSVALVQFLGELYNENFMGPAVIVNCLEPLLDLTDDINISSLCALLRTAGPQLDQRVKTFQEKTPILLTDIMQANFRDKYVTQLNNIYQRIGLLQSSEKLSVKSQRAISDILILLCGNSCTIIGDNVDNQVPVPHIDTDETETETMTEKVDLSVKTRQILNKLRAGNINQIATEFASLTFEDEAEMNTVVDIMLEKIALKASLAKHFANLIHLFCSQEPQASLAFKRFVQTWCKEKFFIHTSKFSLISKQPISKVNPTLESFQEHESLSRKQFRGLTKFIGELFNFKIIPCNVIMQYVNKLLVEKDDGNLECLSILVTIAGQGLQEQTGTTKMFSKILDLANSTDSAVSTQSQTLLKGVISLRKNNWKTSSTVSSFIGSSSLRQSSANVAEILIWGRVGGTSAIVGSITGTLATNKTEIEKPYFTGLVKPPTPSVQKVISKPSLIDSSEFETISILPLLADGRSSSSSSCQVKYLPKPTNMMAPLSSQVRVNGMMRQTPPNSTILSSTSSQVIPNQNTQPVVGPSSSCQTHKLKYLSMYTNYDRMLSQLPSDIVEDINMEFCSIIYQRLKTHKEELDTVVENGSEFETGMFTRI